MRSGTATPFIHYLQNNINTVYPSLAPPLLGALARSIGNGFAQKRITNSRKRAGGWVGDEGQIRHQQLLWRIHGSWGAGLEAAAHFVLNIAVGARRDESRHARMVTPRTRRQKRRLTVLRSGKRGAFGGW